MLSSALPLGILRLRLRAYAARAGKRCVVVIPHGAVATGKLAQAKVHGAQIVSVRGNFDAAALHSQGIGR